MKGKTLLLTMAVALVGHAQAAEDVDLSVVHRIREEAFQHSQVMDHLFWLTDANGPRLTNSPGFRRAAAWAADTLRRMGAANVALEPWGTFGRGWSYERFSLAMVAPTSGPLEGVPKAWTAGTEGAVTADVVYAPLFDTDETDVTWDLDRFAEHVQRYVDRYRGKLRGKIVLLDRPQASHAPEPPERYDAAALAKLAVAPEPGVAPPIELPLRKLPADRDERMRIFAIAPVQAVAAFFRERRRLHDPLNAFLRDEGVVGALTTDPRGPGGIVFAEAAGSYESGAPVPPPTIALAPETYDRLTRLLERKLPVRLALDLGVDFADDSLEGVNVVAELPGNARKDEVVMIGAHLDSWHGGTGATDNAAGCAVVMEAFRILEALGLSLDRSVRLALWSGEEQGLLGSRGYVKKHFGDPATMRLGPEHAKLDAYFNVDNGSGRLRGVYLQGNDMVRPIFAAWLQPFQDLGASTLSIRSTAGTDHLSFDAVGLPGFQFIQDPLDYSSRTHHSNMDVADHVVPGDLMQAAAILASFVYDAANRPQMLPRKPLPTVAPATQAATR